MADLPVIAEPSTLRTKAEGLYLAALLQELRSVHPELVEQAQLALQARPASSPSEEKAVETKAAERKGEASSAEESPAVPPKSAVSDQTPASARESRPTSEIPDREFTALFHTDSSEERRRVEVLASQYMDGYDNGADWVYRDRRCGTVREWDEVRGFGFLTQDLTGQEVFVNRRAVKRMLEPKWRHNLQVGERVTFCKLSSRRGYWAVAILRMADSVPGRVPKREKPAAAEVKEKVEVVPEVTPARAESPTIGPVISGPIHAGPHATLNLATHNYAPAPPPAADKTLAVTIRPARSAAAEEPSSKAVTLIHPAGQLPRSCHPVATAASSSPLCTASDSCLLFVVAVHPLPAVSSYVCLGMHCSLYI